jgi:leucyl aminopeptidase (aminopeptidase T)
MKAMRVTGDVLRAIGGVCKLHAEAFAEVFPNGVAWCARSIHRVDKAGHCTEAFADAFTAKAARRYREAWDTEARRIGWSGSAEPICKWNARMLPKFIKAGHLRVKIRRLMEKAATGHKRKRK